MSELGSRQTCGVDRRCKRERAKQLGSRRLHLTSNGCLHGVELLPLARRARGFISPLQLKCSSVVIVNCSRSSITCTGLAMRRRLLKQLKEEDGSDRLLSSKCLDAWRLRTTFLLRNKLMRRRARSGPRHAAERRLQASGEKQWHSSSGRMKCSKDLGGSVSRARAWVGFTATIRYECWVLCADGI